MINKELKENRFYGFFYNYAVMREIARHEKTLESNIYLKYGKRYSHVVRNGILNDIDPKEIAKEIISLEETSQQIL